jgi:hypothetical protein
VIAVVTLLAALIPTVGGAADPPALLTWLDPDGSEVRFASLAELENFLTTARVVERKRLGLGVTNPVRLLLEWDGVRLHAQFQAVDETRSRARMASGEVENRFRDSYKFNIAAYRLGLVLGMDNIPPSFPRAVDRRPGAVTVWIEDTRTELERLERDERPPQPQRWVREVIRMQLFDELIATTDRNQGNILFDEEWKLWLIDHTRAFRGRAELAEPEAIESCDRRFWSALRDVSDERLRATVEPWLSTRETDALLARRQLLVERIEELLRTLGEERVLHDLE